MPKVIIFEYTKHVVARAQIKNQVVFNKCKTTCYCLHLFIEQGLKTRKRKIYFEQALFFCMSWSMIFLVLDILIDTLACYALTRSKAARKIR